jgi:hypothetical protein
VASGFGPAGPIALVEKYNVITGKRSSSDICYHESFLNISNIVPEKFL